MNVAEPAVITSELVTSKITEDNRLLLALKQHITLSFEINSALNCVPTGMEDVLNTVGDEYVILFPETFKTTAFKELEALNTHNEDVVDNATTLTTELEIWLMIDELLAVTYVPEILNTDARK